MQKKLTEHLNQAWEVYVNGGPIQLVLEKLNEATKFTHQAYIFRRIATIYNSF